MYTEELAIRSIQNIILRMKRFKNNVLVTLKWAGGTKCIKICHDILTVVKQNEQFTPNVEIRFRLRCEFFIYLFIYLFKSVRTENGSVRFVRSNVCCVLYSILCI